jgi:hypothetical protein
MAYRARAIRVEALHLADFVHPDGTPLAGSTVVVTGYAVVHRCGRMAGQRRPGRLLFARSRRTGSCSGTTSP